MGIIQKNLYLPGQDLTNLAQNVDYNRYQDFKGNITVNFGTVPATVTVKVGTILEVNGNLYAIETADYVFQMDNATHNYLTFTDNPAVDFGSAAAIGTYSAAKQGYYQAGNLIRTLPFYIDQANKEVSRLIDEQYNLNRPRMKLFDRVFVTAPAGSHILSEGVLTVFPFSVKVYDELGNFNNGTYTFTASESGWYTISLNITATIDNSGGLPTGVVICYIYIDGNPVQLFYTHTSDLNKIKSGSATIIYYLSVGSTVNFRYIAGVSATVAYLEGSYYSSGIIRRTI